MTQYKNYKIDERKVHSPVIDSIWGIHLADIQLINQFNIEGRFSLCFIDIYSKYAWVISLNVKNRIIITSTFRKILDESKFKSIKV